MSEIKDSIAALAADVESALLRRRSRSAAAISWLREAALLPVLAGYARAAQDSIPGQMLR